MMDSYKKEVVVISNYDDNKGHIHVEINDNGRKKQINMKLKNNDIMNLFKIQPIDKPLHERLTSDFLYKPLNDPTLLKIMHHNKTKKNKKITKKGKQKNNKKRKTKKENKKK